MMLCLCVNALATTKIYKVVKADGSIVYTDKPPANAQEYKLEVKPNIIATPTHKNSATTIPASNSAPSPDYSVTITSPANEATVRNNAGTVTISVNVSPEVKGLYRLIVNGEPTAQQASPVFELQELNRGEYKIKIELLDQSGKLLASSPLSTFYLHKASALINAN